MHYYEVFVASQRYHRTEPLTYASEDLIHVGAIAIVPLQKEQVPGVVVKKVSRPRFATKPIIRVFPDVTLPKQLLSLTNWLQQYYPAPSGATMQLLLPSTLLQESRHRDTIIDPPEAPLTLPALTEEQHAAVSTVTSGGPKSYLLHGDTGTGKTRVYLELAKECLDRGQSALVLTPEIGLTPQLALSFTQAFPGRVIVTHSTLTPAQRRNAWLHIARATEPIIIIGARSALFNPISKLGLIIMDEMHDTAYKQEQSPYYVATRVAAKLASIHGAYLIMGSATPAISDYYLFKEKQLPILRLAKPAITSEHETTIAVVNLRDRQHFSKSSWISDQLVHAIRDALAANKQSMVFLNRRGTARLVLCQDCGWQALCPNCDLPLTYHADNHQLRCHTCGHTATTPSTCESCRSTNILFKSIGTKTLVEQLQNIFPKARIQRFDSDSSKAERLEQHYDALRDGTIDIIVGTQMLSKGLDLPHLRVVGVALADTGLYFPDYTAEERTFQMLNQVIGRVGRGHGESTIIIQTYNPDSPTLISAIEKDYQTFYERQLQERKMFGFPPFYHTLKLSCSRASSAAASNAAIKLADTLRTQQGLEIVGPSPAFTEKTHGKYNWQIILKSRRRSLLTDVIPQLPANWFYDIDPSNLL